MNITNVPKKDSGLTLIELMISLVLVMLLGIVLFNVLYETLYDANAQRGMTSLQQAERRAASNIQMVAHEAGYFYVTGETVSGVQLSDLTLGSQFPAYSNAYGSFMAGQPVQGVSASGDNGDILNIRLQSVQNNNPYEPTTLNCLGQANTGSTSIIYDNSYFVDPSTHSLDCSVNGGTPHILVGAGGDGGVNIQSMSILYGVGTSGSGSVDTYEHASQITADNDWNNVLTSRVTLYFNNPLYVSGDSDGQSPTIPFTFDVDFMGDGNVN